MNNNQIISQRMRDVSHCLAELAKRGLAITDIKISDSKKPCITILGYSKTPGGLQGGMLMRIKHHQQRFETYATEVNGCQVQWKVVA